MLPLTAAEQNVKTARFIDDDLMLMCVYIRLTVGSVNRRCSTSGARSRTSQPPSTNAATASTQLFSSGYISSPNYPARYEPLYYSLYSITGPPLRRPPTTSWWCCLGLSAGRYSKSSQGILLLLLIIIAF